MIAFWKRPVYTVMKKSLPYILYAVPAAASACLIPSGFEQFLPEPFASMPLSCICVPFSWLARVQEDFERHAKIIASFVCSPFFLYGEMRLAGSKEYFTRKFRGEIGKRTRAISRRGLVRPW